MTEIVRSLEYSEVQRRLSAARALTRMGPAAKDATQPLIRALGDKDDRVREQVVRALGAIGPVAEAAVPALLEALKNRRFGKRSRRVWRGHGEDNRWNARAAVPAALASIAPNDSETIAHLAQYIGDSNPCVGVA